MHNKLKIIAFILLFIFGFTNYLKANFLQNKGQWPEQVLFGYTQGNVSYYIEKDGITVDLTHPLDVFDLHGDREYDVGDEIRKHAFKLQWKGSSWQGDSALGDQLPGYTNWMIGGVESHISHMISFEGFTLKDIWVGIDVRFYSNGKSLKYDYIIHPGADIRQLIYTLQGVDKVVKLNEEWHIYTSCGVIKESLPLVYQKTDQGGIKEIPSSFERDGNYFYFESFDYNTSKTLIIDPELILASYVGVQQGAAGNAVGCGSDFFPNGDILVIAGLNLWQGSYPVTEGSYFVPSYTSTGVGLSRFDSNTGQLVWSTAISGATASPEPMTTSIRDNKLYLVSAISVTPEALASEAPAQYENRYPSTLPSLTPFPLEYGPSNDYLVCSVLSGEGDSLFASRVLSSTIRSTGTSALTNGIGSFVNHADLEFAQNGDLVMVFTTNNENVPITDGVFDSVNTSEFGSNIRDAVLLRISPDLEDLRWCTFFGGDHRDFGMSLLLDNQDNPIIAGASRFDSAITTEGAWMHNPTSDTDYNGFIAKLSQDGQELMYGTHLGFPIDLENPLGLFAPVEPIRFIEFGPDSCIWAYGVGIHNASDILISDGSYNNPTGRGILCKFSPDLSELLLSSRVGFSGLQHYAPTAFMVDNCGYIYTAANSAPSQGPPVPGWIQDAPLTEDAYQDSGGFYMAVYEPDLAGLRYSTLLGGDHVDGSHSKFDKKGVVYQTVCVPPFEIGFNAADNAWASESYIDWEAGFYIFDFESPASTAVLEVNRLDSANCPPYVLQVESHSTEGEITWFIDNEEITPDEEGLLTLDQTGWIELALSVFNPETCNQSDTVRRMIQLPQPDLVDADWNIELSDLCNPEGGTLTAVFTGQHANEFQWSTWNGPISALDSLSIDFDVPGEYQLSLQVSESNCFSSEELNFEFDYNPLVFNTTIIESDPCVLPGEVNGEFEGSGADQYSWFIDGELIGSEASFFASLDQGSYTVEFIAESDNCGSQSTQTEITFSGTVVASILGTDLTLCEGDQISLNASLNQGTGSWSIEGQAFNGSNVEYQFDQAGTEWIIFIGTDSLSCNITSIDSIGVSIISRATADFRIQYTPSLCASETDVQLEFTGSNAASLSWNMGDGNYYTEDNPQHSYLSTGSYSIELLVENPPCPAVSALQSIDIVLLEEAIELRTESINVISPNDDGINDCLQFFTEETEVFVSDYGLKVFNRWGNLVHESKNPIEKWCAEALEEGVYFYLLEFFDRCKKTQQKIEQSLTVVR